MANQSTTPRVLIVDDTRTNIAVLVKALRDDYRLGVATGGAEALEYLQEHDVDLVLLDIMMPDIDGYEVCSRLKADERTGDIPVIFITALNEVENKTRGFELGAVDYITKPFEIVEIKARVRTHLSIRQYRQELEDRNEALEKAHEGLRFQVKELEGRDRLVRAQMSVTSLDQAGDEVLQAVAHILEAERMILYQPAEKGDLLEVRGMLGTQETPATVQTDDPLGLTARAFRAREPQQGGDDLAVPLLYRKKVLGVLWIAGLRMGPIDCEVALDALWRLAGEAALVLHAAKLAEELERGELDVSGLLELDDDGASSSHSS